MSVDILHKDESKHLPELEDVGMEPKLDTLLSAKSFSEAGKCNGNVYLKTQLCNTNLKQITVNAMTKINKLPTVTCQAVNAWMMTSHETNISLNKYSNMYVLLQVTRHYWANLIDMLRLYSNMYVLPQVTRHSWANLIDMLRLYSNIYVLPQVTRHSWANHIDMLRLYSNMYMLPQVTRHSWANPIDMLRLYSNMYMLLQVTRHY